MDVSCRYMYIQDFSKMKMDIAIKIGTVLRRFCENRGLISRGESYINKLCIHVKCEINQLFRFDF